MSVRVEFDACVAGNPRKGWRRDDGRPPYIEGEEEDPPNDVWEHRTQSFEGLKDAKHFVEKLPEPTTTHVVMWAEDEEGGYLLWEQDRDADGLKTLGLGRPEPEPEPYDPNAVPSAPPLYEE